MARPLRIEYEGAFYHITARGNEHRQIYYSEADYEKFKGYLSEAQKKFGYLLHFYVLMTNHYHLLMETPQANMSKVMHYINSSYTNYINKKRKRSGHLFQGRFMAILVESDSYLLELSRYIHLNPVRAKMVAKPEDYVYSSYRSYIFDNFDSNEETGSMIDSDDIDSESKEKLVCQDLVLEMISKNPKNSRKSYRDFVERGIEEQLDNPLTNVYGGAILGGKTFIKESLGRLKAGILEKEDIAHRKELYAPYGSEDIIEAICSHFKIFQEEIFETGCKYRNMAIYLMKKLTAMNNKQIGKLFGDLSYSAVAKVYQRFSLKIKGDKPLRKDVEKIKANLS